jgi:hypothetical protein
MSMQHMHYPCPCCGYLVFERQPGSNEKCPICLWEDDLAQLRFPHMPGSANHVSLEEAQHNFAACGAAERRNAGSVRTPVSGEARDRSWRPLDPFRDNIEEPRRGINYADSYPLSDTTVLYYWRETYWRRLAS